MLHNGATIRSIQTAAITRIPRPSLTVKGARGAHARSDFLLVRVEASTPRGRVVEGFGEVSGTLVWSGEDATTAEYVVRRVLAPGLAGADLAPIGGLEAAMDKAVAGHPFAKAGVSMALWDCWANLLDVPLAVALGGPYRSRIPIKMSLSGDGDTLTGCVDSVRALGVTGFKVKVGVGGVAADVARVAQARTLIGPQAFLAADANGGWSHGEATLAIRQLSDLDLSFVEQPCAPWDLRAAHDLRKLGIPVVADEAVFALPDLIRVIDARAADVVSVYVGKAGGPARAVEQGRIAATFGLGTVLGSNGELGLGAAAQLHAACAMPELSTELRHDIIGALYYDDDILATPLPSNGDEVALPDGPGLGVRLREDILKRFH